MTMTNSTGHTNQISMVLSEVHDFMRSTGNKEHHKLLSVCNEVDGKVIRGYGLTRYMGEANGDPHSDDQVYLDKHQLEAHIVSTYGIAYWREMESNVITILR